MSKLRIALFLCVSVLFSGFSGSFIFAQDRDRDRDRDDRRVTDRDHDRDHDRDDNTTRNTRGTGNIIATTIMTMTTIATTATKAFAFSPCARYERSSFSSASVRARSNAT